jgi:signal transduction histidine kinase
MLDDLGLVATLRWYLERQAHRAGFLAHFTAEPEEMALPAELATACFRVAQEALTNIARHSQAHRVRISLGQSASQLRLRIQDDGRGFRVEAALARASRGGSQGLLGMQERVMLLDGQLEIDSAPGHGTEIRVEFPLPE